MTDKEQGQNWAQNVATEDEKRDLLHLMPVGVVTITKPTEVRMLFGHDYERCDLAELVMGALSVLRP